MEFSINKDVLRNELGLAYGLMDKKPVIPMLSSVLIKALSAEVAMLTATNLDLTYHAVLPVELKKAGSLCLEAKKLLEIASKTVNDTVTFKSDKDDWAKVESGNSKYRIAGSKPDDFPHIELGDIVYSPVNRLDFLDGLTATHYATTTETSRAQLGGVRVELTDEYLKCVATDAHRLPILTRKHELEVTPFDCLLPKKAAVEFQNLLRALPDETVLFGQEENHIVLKTELQMLIARKLTGEFPNYHPMIPKTSPNEFTISAKDFGDAIRRVAIVIDNRSLKIWLEIGGGKLKISGASAEEGEADETLSIKYSGEPVRMGLNYKYVLDALDYLDESDVRFTFLDDKQQIELRRGGDVGDFQYIVSQLRF